MILSLDIPPLAKQYAWLFLRQNNMGQRGTFDGTKEQQYTGLLGEICFKRLTTGLWPMLESGYDGGFDLKQWVVTCLCAPISFTTLSWNRPI